MYEIKPSRNSSVEWAQRDISARTNVDINMKCEGKVKPLCVFCNFTVREPCTMNTQLYPQLQDTLHPHGNKYSSSKPSAFSRSVPPQAGPSPNGLPLLRAMLQSNCSITCTQPPYGGTNGRGRETVLVRLASRPSSMEAAKHKQQVWRNK